MTKHVPFCSNFLVFGVLLLLFGNCKKNQEQIDLEPDQLVRILSDLSIAEAATAQMAGYEKDSLTKVYYNQVFEIHHTSPEQLERNLRLYSKNLERMEQIVKKVEESVSTEIKEPKY
ncbi:MAG: DUF4296 domain-containing protein [Bacteroidetes bacterium]|nr:DUF4296 domain-containing protein [Bacteroidota bacterium]